MDENTLRKTFASLPTGEIQYFESIGSTNDYALQWAHRGAFDLSMVVADEQTKGRGRLNRRWVSNKGSCLAVSIIINPFGITSQSRIVGLSALAICRCCQKYGLRPLIKWPNDILLNGEKVAGILVESAWVGDQVVSLVVGIGINVGNQSMPPNEKLQFPATCLERHLGCFPDREKLLLDVITEFIGLRSRTEAPDFMEEWEKSLAYRGENVRIGLGNGSSLTGRLVGLEKDGSLRIIESSGKLHHVQYGDISLRPSA